MFLEAEGFAALDGTLSALVAHPPYTEFPEDEVLNHHVSHLPVGFLHSHMSNFLYEFIVKGLLSHLFQKMLLEHLSEFSMHLLLSIKSLYIHMNDGEVANVFSYCRNWKC